MTDDDRKKLMEMANPFSECRHRFRPHEHQLIAVALHEIDRLRAELAAAQSEPPRSIESLTVAHEGKGEPCHACGATNTVKISAMLEHYRCLHCGNSFFEMPAKTRNED